MIADRFPGTSPAEVEDWPVGLVEDALLRIELESSYQRSQQRKRGARSG